eukprot:2589145-Alexandrium_andersonii.AAC.1
MDDCHVARHPGWQERSAQAPRVQANRDRRAAHVLPHGAARLGSLGCSDGETGGGAIRGRAL